MNTSQFGPSKTGKIIPISGVPELTHAFIPNPFPPKWKWQDRLWPLLRDARVALASLDGIGKYLPNPTLVLRPLQNREAQCSSSLEGTITDPQQQALFQIDPKYPTSKEDPANAFREVFNYGRALKLRLETKEELPLSLRLIIELQGVLMDGVRGDEQDPGNFRRTQNQIGHPARYVPPPANHLSALLDNLEKYLHEDTSYDPLVNAFLVHYQFEAIHPFRDGNGRVGRLLLSILIAEWCNLSSQWLYMSAYFDRNRDRYLDHLFNISSEGKWENWIEFCLEGTVIQAKDAEKRCTQFLDLNREFLSKIETIGGSLRLATMIDDLFEHPVVTITKLADKHNVTYNTAKSDVEKLESAGILQELSGTSQKTHFCPRIFDITYKDL